MASTSENDDERKIREYIEADPKMKPFFESLNSVLQDYFVATMSVRTGDMAADTESKNKAMLSTLLQGIPLGSQGPGDMNAVMKVYVSLDMTRAMDNLLSVVPDYTEISGLIKQLACNVTLALKNVHIDKLDSTRDPQGIWPQLKDHILSKQPTNVYEEEGMICGRLVQKTRVLTGPTPQDTRGSVWPYRKF